MTLSAWPRRAAFSERVERLELHGLHFWHATICRRRAWFHLHRVNFAQWNETVAMGAARHAASHSRDRSAEGLLGLAPDRIDWAGRKVFEHKGTDSYTAAADLQAAFYAVMMALATGHEWTAVVHVISARRSREIVLDRTLLDRLWALSGELEALARETGVPAATRIKACARCSFAPLCWNR